MLKRSLATLLALVGLSGLAALPLTANGASHLQELQILSLAGWRGQLEALEAGDTSVGGAALLASYWEADRDRVPASLTLGSGNSFGAAPPISNLFHDEPAVEALNLLELDADSLGNDNFDRSLGNLQSLIDLSQFPYLAANFANVEGNLSSVEPYHIFDVGGVRVAVVGVTDPVSPSRVFPGNFGTIEITAPAPAAQAARGAAESEGATVFVLVTEMTGTSTTSGPLIDLANEVDGFDLILGSSSAGDDFSATLNGALVVAGRPQSLSYARTALTVEDGEVTETSVTFVAPVADGVIPDAELTALVESYRGRLGDSLSQVVGNSLSPIPMADACGQVEGRTCESLAGNVISDAMRLAYDADFALTNAGGIRSDLTCPPTDLRTDFCPAFEGPAYPISEGQVQAALPFANIAVTLSVSGAELKSLLENGVSLLPEAGGRFPQVSGLCFTYDLSRPPGSRITSAVRQSGDGACSDEALSFADDTSYTLVTNDYIAAGGDGYPVVAAQPRVEQQLLTAVLSRYLADAGEIGPVLQGRITCTSNGEAVCPVAAAPVSIAPPATGDAGLR